LRGGEADAAIQCLLTLDRHAAPRLAMTPFTFRRINIAATRS
jgi:hypothetical protein